MQQFWLILVVWEDVKGKKKTLKIKEKVLLFSESYVLGYICTAKIKICNQQKNVLQEHSIIYSTKCHEHTMVSG